MKCLVIEDDDDLGELWLAHLEVCGIRADVARNLHEASSKILTHDYDVVISDIDLPDGNGMELTHLLAFRQPDTPVVVVTGRSDFENGELFTLYHNIAAVFRKTENFEDICAYIEHRYARRDRRPSAAPEARSAAG